MNSLRTVFLTLTLVAPSMGCLQAVEMGSVPKVSTEWRRTLYGLEMFEYEPVDAGTSLFLPTGPHVPNGGMLVTVTRDRHIRAMRAIDGVDIWKVQTGSVNVARPVDFGEDILVGSMDGHIYRLHKRNGAEVYKAPFPEGEAIRAAPIVAAGGTRLVATSIGNRIAAFDSASGALVWDKKRPHAGEFTITGQAGPLALGDDTVATGFSDGRLVAFSLEDGATLWSTDLRENKRQFVDVDTTPQLIEGAEGGQRLIVAGSYGVGLFGIKADDGEVAWLVRGEGFVEPAQINGTLYTTQPSGYVSAIRGSDGRTLWRRKVDIGTPQRPSVSRKYLLVPNGEGLLMMWRDSGRPVTMIRDSRGFSGTPEFAFGTAYAISNSGVYYALALY